MNICKPINGVATEIQPLPIADGNTSLFGHLTDKLKAEGWRWHVPLAFDVHTKATGWVDDGTSFRERATALWTDEELARQAADAKAVADQKAAEQKVAQDAAIAAAQAESDRIADICMKGSVEERLTNIEMFLRLSKPGFVPGDS